MPSKRKTRTPAYRFHKPSRQAVLTLSGRDHYLGPHGTEASKAEYDRLVAKWLAGNRKPLRADLDEHAAPPELTIVELVARYWAFAE